MMQFYFLSIVFNILAGLALILDPEVSGDVPLLEGLKTSLKNETTRLILAILTSATGVFKILSVTRMDVVIVGDLFPALAGITTGIALFYEFYAGRSSLSGQSNPVFQAIFVARKKWIGYAALLAAVLHFIFPNVLFL